MTKDESNDSSHSKMATVSVFSKLNQQLGIVQSSRVYIVEHFVMLVSLALVLVSGIGLFNAIINHFMDDPEAITSFGAVISFEELALYLAIALVALPAFLVFYTRTRMAERSYPALVDARNRRRLSYVFLMISSLFIVGFAIGLMYSSVLAIIGGNNIGNGGEGWLQTTLKQLFAIEFIGLVTYFVSRMSNGLSQKGAR